MLFNKSHFHSCFINARENEPKNHVEYVYAALLMLIQNETPISLPDWEYCMEKAYNWSYINDASWMIEESWDPLLTMSRYTFLFTIFFDTSKNTSDQFDYVHYNITYKPEALHKTKDEILNSLCQFDLKTITETEDVKLKLLWFNHKDYQKYLPPSSESQKISKLVKLHKDSETAYKDRKLIGFKPIDDYSREEAILQKSFDELYYEMSLHPMSLLLLCIEDMFINDRKVVEKNKSLSLEEMIYALPNYFGGLTFASVLVILRNRFNFCTLYCEGKDVKGFWKGGIYDIVTDQELFNQYDKTPENYYLVKILFAYMEYYTSVKHEGVVPRFIKECPGDDPLAARYKLNYFNGKESERTQRGVAGSDERMNPKVDIRFMDLIDLHTRLGWKFFRLNTST